MLKALDTKGKEVVAYNRSKQELQIMRQQSHYCPECHERVILKAGTVVIPHFAHDNRVNCSHQGESKTHLEGKLKLYQWCVNQRLYAKLEHYIPSIEQRADVMVKLANRWIALEYQCSPISTSSLIDRTLGLSSKGVYPLWIFGPSYLDMNQHDVYWNTTLRSAVQYNHKANQDQLLFYNPKSNLFTIATHLYNAKAKATAHLRRIPLEQLTWKTLYLPTQPSKYKLYKQWSKEKKLFRSALRRFPSKYDESLMKQLYYQNLHPQNLPSCVYLPIKNSNRLLVPDYLWQTKIVLFLKQKKVGECIQFINLLNLTRMYFKDTIECIYPRCSTHPLLEYLELLCQLGYLTSQDCKTFYKEKEFEFYNTLEQALYGDEVTLKKLLNF
ncbi:competence protein CoiA [Piscibacillus sp. B03]|uniref:competence protein CoiA n=1 Tax=Piscibacillus sp. B03 TaxID=3457430 RepID=UPI003FCE9393